MATSLDDEALKTGLGDPGARGRTVKPRSAASTKQKSTSAHRIAFLVHSFIGLKLTLLFSIVLLTGALAVFAQEIDWLVYSETRVTPQEEKLNPGEVFDRMQAALPEYGFTGYQAMLDRDRTAGNAFVTLPDGGLRMVYADPYTGEVTGETGLLTVGRFLSFLHTTLFLPVFGRAFVNFFGILCLVGLITGLISYRKFWKHFFRMPRFHKKPRIWLGDLHRLIGLWSLWFVLIMGITGTWWFYQNPLVHYKVAPQFLPTRAAAPGLTNEDLDALGNTIPTRLSAREIVDAVQAHDPEFLVTGLSPPEHAGMAYSVRGTHHDLLTSSHSSAYYVNPFTGAIIGDRLARDMPALSRVDAAMHPLHYGTWAFDGWGDVAVKAVWFLFGIAMTGLAISGLVIYYQRTGNAVRKLLPEKGLKRKAIMTWQVVRPWGGPMSAFKYVNWAFTGMIFVGLGVVLTLQSEGASGSGYLYGKQRVGDWTVSMNVIMGFLEKDLDPIQPGRSTTLVAHIEGGDFDGIKFMYAKINKPRTTRAPGDVIHGVRGFMHAHMKVPETLKDGTELWITIEDWSGEFYQASWPLMPDGERTIDLRKADADTLAQNTAVDQQAAAEAPSTN
ncbi:MAG: PepSY-associated TM helix domain-containing protein [Pseudomonadota bacterium]